MTKIKKFKPWTEIERDIFEQANPMAGKKGETTRKRYERRQRRSEERMVEDARKNGPTIQEEF